jgi:hypothetical protein
VIDVAAAEQLQRPAYCGLPLNDDAVARVGREASIIVASGICASGYLNVHTSGETERLSRHLADPGCGAGADPPGAGTGRVG